VIDEVYEETVSEEPEEALAPEESSAPEIPSETVETDPAAGTVPDPGPVPDIPSGPVEVVTVEDLLDRLTGESREDGQTQEDAGTEGPAPEGESSGSASGNDLPAAVVDGGPIEIVGMDTVLKRLETIQGTVDHSMMETSFEDYTVTEGLLLLLFLSVIVAACVKMLRGGFAWLR